MIRGRYCFFTITLAAVIFILLSTIVLAAPGDMCDCDSSGGGCDFLEFCDPHEDELYSGGCNYNDPFSGQCITCRGEGDTCIPSYADADCCDEPGLSCTYGVPSYRCCPNGEKWNATLGSCQAPPPANPCAGSGSGAVGDAYCSSLGIGKDLCCGTANNGHCEECCTLANCPGFCEYCNTSGSVGTWSCDDQVNTDLKDDCGSIYQICRYGACDWIDATPSAGCEWPTEPVFQDGKIYELVMCTYNCGGQCPYADPYTLYPDNWNFCKGSGDNPFWGFNTHGCTWCLSDALPDCIDVCVVTEGEGCEDYRSADNPQGCCDHNDECSENHCCPAGRAWNGTDCGPCNPMPTTSNYLCANPHTGGSASCTCGGPCYYGDVHLPNGSVYYNVVQNCGPSQRCIQYHPDPVLDPDMPPSLKVCSACKEDATCCSPEMAATTDAQCKACNVNWYLSNGHCCEKAYGWVSALGMCTFHDPCYALSNPGFCNSMAPNSPLPMSTWWDNPFITLIGCIASDRSACCYNGTGLYGYLPGEQFYYWHEGRSIIVY